MQHARAQSRLFGWPLCNFRRPIPCRTHGCNAPRAPFLGPTNELGRSKELLPRQQFHDPPPDG